jgi:hypothetical protein
MKGKNEGRKIKLNVGGTPLVIVDLCKTNFIFEKIDGNDHCD